VEVDKPIKDNHAVAGDLTKNLELVEDQKKLPVSEMAVRQTKDIDRQPDHQSLIDVDPEPSIMAPTKLYYGKPQPSKIKAEVIIEEPRDVLIEDLDLTAPDAGVSSIDTVLRQNTLSEVQPDLSDETVLGETNLWQELAIEESGASFVLGQNFTLEQAEHLGGLLIGSLEVTYNPSEPSELLESPDYLPPAMPSSQEELFTSPEPARLQISQKKIKLYLESLQPSYIEAAGEIVEALATTARERKSFLEKNDPDFEATSIKLKDLSVKLFDCLGIDYNEEFLQQFIQGIISEQIGGDPALGLDPKELSISGTHEYKFLGSSYLINDLTKLIKNKLLTYLNLGGCSLRACVV
jgi:hypothetical protein